MNSIKWLHKLTRILHSCQLCLFYNIFLPDVDFFGYTDKKATKGVFMNCFKNITEASDYVVNYIIDQINSFVPTSEKPFFVLGLPTGSTPIPVYERLVEAYKKGRVSFKNVVTFNMDEYVGLDEKHPQSYHFFMFNHLFKHIDIPRNQIHILNGMVQNFEEECFSYEEKIKSFGGIDIQLGGIGENGHLAFNEPNTPFDMATHLQRLTDDTIAVNARFFDKISDVPTHALTVGLATIFSAKKIIILAFGEKKANAVYNSLKGKISPECPASMLQLHPNAEIVCDEQAASVFGNN